MEIQKRIEQLEKREKWLMDSFPYAFDVYMNTDRFEYKCSLTLEIRGQIQALKWVEAERERELKELGEFLKDMEPVDISPERIKRELQSSGGVYYKSSKKK